MRCGTPLSQLSHSLNHSINICDASRMLQDGAGSGSISKLCAPRGSCLLLLDQVWDKHLQLLSEILSKACAFWARLAHFIVMLLRRVGACVGL